MIRFYILLIFIISSSTYLIAQDDEYSFDFSEFEKKPYEFIGNIEVGSDFQFLNSSSKLYELYFFGKDNKDEFFNSQNVSLNLAGSYELSMFKFFTDVKMDFTLDKDIEFEAISKLNEAYVDITFPHNISLNIGKTSVKWGKGYVYNPVSYIGRAKDINDVDAGLEGYLMAKLNYVKSFSSASLIRNFSITAALLPVIDELDETDYYKYSETSNENINYFLSTYFLVNNTDIDFYFQINDEIDERNNKSYFKLGADFAHNFFENWEIHGEYSFENTKRKFFIHFGDYDLLEGEKSLSNFLLGTRILFPSNTTMFFEYFHNDFGYSLSDMESFYSAAKSVLANNNLRDINSMKSFQAKNLNSQYQMKDYIYLKLSHPEPFDILYFTPSIFSLYNLADNSQMIGGEFNYSKFENLNIKLKYNIMIGDENTEFGEKLASSKVSAIIDYTF